MGNLKRQVGTNPAIQGPNRGKLLHTVIEKVGRCVVFENLEFSADQNFLTRRKEAREGGVTGRSRKILRNENPYRHREMAPAGMQRGTFVRWGELNERFREPGVYADAVTDGKDQTGEREIAKKGAV